jgi:hypothetical protein
VLNLYVSGPSTSSRMLDGRWTYPLYDLTPGVVSQICV